MVMNMKIKKEVYEYIALISNKENSEIGGILGGTDNGVITDVVPDIPPLSKNCRFSYTPNVDFLNEKIEEWIRNGKIFWGIFHTHFSGSFVLSNADTEYIEKIMFDLKNDVEYLYFPIYTLPNQVLTVYKARICDNELLIEKEEIDII